MIQTFHAVFMGLKTSLELIHNSVLLCVLFLLTFFSYARNFYARRAQKILGLYISYVH